MENGNSPFSVEPKMRDRPQFALLGQKLSRVGFTAMVLYVADSRHTFDRYTYTSLRFSVNR